jgi:hypothetical protein
MSKQVNLLQIIKKKKKKATYFDMNNELSYFWLIVSQTSQHRIYSFINHAKMDPFVLNTNLQKK